MSLTFAASLATATLPSMTAKGVDKHFEILAYLLKPENIHLHVRGTPAGLDPTHFTVIRFAWKLRPENTHSVNTIVIEDTKDTDGTIRNDRDHGTLYLISREGERAAGGHVHLDLIDSGLGAQLECVVTIFTCSTDQELYMGTGGYRQRTRRIDFDRLEDVTDEPYTWTYPDR